MTVWPFGDGIRAHMTAESRELLRSWNSTEEDSRDEARPQDNESWTGYFDVRGLRNDPAKSEANLGPGLQPLELTGLAGEKPSAVESLKMTGELQLFQSSESKREASDADDAFVLEKIDGAVSPLQRVQQILEDQSASSRWLKQRGYLDVFSSPDCSVDLSFSTDKNGMSRVGAVVFAPDGSKRTVIACGDGTHYQRVSGPGGQELVRILSNGQVLESGKRSL